MIEEEKKETYRARVIRKSFAAKKDEEDFS